MAQVVVRFFGGAAAAAGCQQSAVTACDIAQLRTVLVNEFGPRLDQVLTVSSLLVDGAVATDVSMSLPDSATVDVLPPYAGG
ncbi:MAG: MoaD/ThiS family protein [Candidatus Nanopelagicales bacterium]